MRMQRLSILLALLLWVAWGIAQPVVQPSRLIEKAKEKGQSFQQANLLELSPVARDEGPLEGELRTYDILQVKRETLQALLKDRPEAIKLDLPSSRRSKMEVELVRVNLFASGFSVYESGASGPAEVESGLHYRGTLTGEEGSIVALSVFDDELMGLVSSPAQGNLVLGKLGGDEWNGEHVLYNDDELAHLQGAYCDTQDPGRPYTAEELSAPVEMRDAGDCVRIYFEVDYDIYQDKGGTTGATNYITGIFNEAATLYANENINVSISEIFVWNQPSPYTGTSSSKMLSEFQSVRTSFNGDLAQLLSYKASGGIAVVSGFCRSNPALRMSFSSVGSSFRQVPEYSFTVMVVTHELGHLMGSQHTHACVWNNNSTAIDGCAGFTEGGCPNPGTPSNGGTIMSYCHLTSAGINFSLGFGTQPGNVIRNGVANASCLTACSDDGGGGGGGGGSDCTENPLMLSIVLDNYGSETTWQLQNETGSVLASGGPYSNGNAGQTITKELCVPDGCYKFVINDAYGDGICCGYGNGSYKLTDAGGAVLASGSNFGASESTDFCTNGTPPPDDPGCTGREYTLSLTLDDYGRETSWSLKNSSGTSIASDGPFDNKLSGQTLTETFCLPEGCYVFEILDAYGDGICCNYGNGSFNLVDDQGNTIASGGNFGAGKRVEFCTSGDGGGGGSSCITIDLNDYSIDSYGGNQDQGTHELLSSGTVLKIQDNAWKSIPLDYNITGNTVIEFEFRSSRQGEIHGLGFDDNSSISSSLTFNVYGSQSWGITDFQNYPGNDTWKAYSIPVGQFYTGVSDRFFFVADHDGSPSDGNSFFRNIRIHEGGGCEGQIVEPETTVLNIEELAPDALDIFPNPVSDQLTLRFKGKEPGSAQLQIFNVMGQELSRQVLSVQEGANVHLLPVSRLPQGTYYLRLNNGDLRQEAKFIVQ